MDAARSGAATIRPALQTRVFRVAGLATGATVFAVLAISVAPALFPYTLSHNLDLGTDRSGAEFIEYAFMAGAAAALFAAPKGSMIFDLRVWAVLFIVLALDNALALHESAGTWAGRTLFGAAPDARHYGQALVLLCVYGAIFAALLARAVRNPALGGLVYPLLALTLFYGGFGGFADFAHHFAPGAIAALLHAVEDRGEFAATAAIFLYALALSIALRR
jgi:hypothetical protein